MVDRGMPPTGGNTPYDNMSAAPMGSGSAVQDPSDPYAKSYASPYAQYPSWSQQETPLSGSDYSQSNGEYQATGAARGLTRHEVAWYGRVDNHLGPTRPNHIVELNDKVETVVWADEGPRSVDPISLAMAANTNPTEPGNHPPDDPRIVRAGVGYTFLRDWWKASREKEMNGSHVSLADNAVVNPVGGMRPNYERNKRNTYRIEPEPWDLNYVDLSVDPTQNATAPAGPVVPPNVNGRSYRLG